jgi:NADH-quinone oxidoreductase subunit N
MGAPGSAEHPWLFRILALVAGINAAIGAWYYLRIVAVMYLRSPIRPLPKRHSWPGLVTLWICGLVTLILGVYPQPLAKRARDAVASEPSVEQRAER